MPYVVESAREWIDNGDAPYGCGTLNYKITKLIDAYVAAIGLNYDTINTVIGVLECAKLEAYRRIAAPYEDKKCEQNGDVYTCV